MENKIRIKEAIVVEGRDDTAAINRAVEAQTIETHGFGLSKKTWTEIETAANTCGIIIFTDPDRAGENIRRKIKTKYPNAIEAFLPQNKALKAGNIGVENALPEDIIEALEKAHRVEENIKDSELFSMSDMENAGLVGESNSRAKREKLAAILGIGYGSSKALLKKLNSYGIKKEDFYGALQSISDKADKE